VLALSPVEGSITSDAKVLWVATDNFDDITCWINVDASGWQPVISGSSFDLNVPDGPHTVRVKAIDGGGNVAVRTVNFTLDTTAPEVTITAPSAGAIIRGSYVDVSWESTDDVGISRTEMKVDDSDWREVSGSEVSHIQLGSGYHSLQIRVTDKAGHQTVDQVGFNTDNWAMSVSGPYYGTPLVATIVLVILAALMAILKYTRLSGEE
jgi:hypothetical protein